jgi:ABC-type uncharacterized transport system involved in gliding motility auxiliary subunit
VSLTKKLPIKSANPIPQTSPAPSRLPSSTTTASPTPPSLPTPVTDEKSQPTATESRLVVLGNSDFATDGLFQNQLNGDVFLNSVTWLSQQDQQSLSIRPKETKNRRINLTTTQANLLTLSSLFFLPLIGFVTAVAIWWKRR